MHWSNIFRTFIRLVIGLLFVFSGYVKAIDPMGSAIKFAEYFEAFGIAFLVPGALVFGILLAQAELLIGLAFLFGMRMKLASWSALFFMVFFTFLTFELARTNAVKDCGCFGDAIKLTNWETFYKNIIILPFVVYIFVYRKKFHPLFSNLIEWILAGIIALSCIFISVYTYRHLPFIDFMPYKVGVNLPDAMKMPENAPQDVYESVFIYEKDGKQNQFTLDNLPDSTWNFVDTKNTLIKEGYTPPAKDFSIADQNGKYVQDQVLAQPGYLFFLTSADVNSAEITEVERIRSIYAYAKLHNIVFIFLSGSANNMNEQFLAVVGESIPCYHTDETVLKSMVRSNPGLMLLKDGVILEKWNNRDMPTVKELEKLMAQEAGNIIEANASATARTNIIWGIYLLLWFVVFSIRGMRNYKRNEFYQ